MKQFITIIALALATLTLSAKEVCRNPITEKVLDNTAGIYSIKGKTGIIPLGTEDQAKRFILKAADSFVDSMVGYFVNINDQEYKVEKDEAGLYIFKVGLGAVKIRLSDITCFGLHLGLKDGKNFVKDVYQEGKSRFKKYRDTLKN